MALLDDLMEEKAAARLELDRVSLEVSREKARIADKRAAEKRLIIDNGAAKKVNLLLSENARLRGLIAIYERSEGKTMREISDTLGVTPERARQVLEKAKRGMQLWRYDKNGESIPDYENL